jgi:acyl carrier protein
MTTREEIFAHLEQLLVEHFELDRGKITLEAKLYDDLNIDSIDPVDLMVELKNYTGRKIDPDIFKQIRTIDDDVSAVIALMSR